MGKLIVVISLVALLIPGVASANLLLNPGFESTGESGHTTNWSNAAPDGWNNNIFGAQDNPQSGAWHARNSNDGGLWQDVAITGGESYKLTGWVYSSRCRRQSMGFHHRIQMDKGQWHLNRLLMGDIFSELDERSIQPG